MKRLISLFIFITLQSTLYSQNPSEDFLGSWYSYSSSHRLSEQFSLAPHAELRFYEPFSNYNLVVVSLRGNYHINSKSVLGLGYAYLDIDTAFEFDDRPHLHEHRIIEQYVYNHNFGKIKLQHRGRLEQRFLEFSNKNELQNRFRYKLSFRYNLNKTFFLVIYEEPIVNFQDQVFHENRFYTGIGINILKHAQLQIGYLKHHILKTNLNRILIGISFQTDSRKPKTTASQQ